MRPAAGQRDDVESLGQGWVADEALTRAVHAALVYPRNLIGEWNALQTAARDALHRTLLAAAGDSGCRASESKEGWTVVRAESPAVGAFLESRNAGEILVWTKSDLLTTPAGSRFRGLRWTFTTLAVGS